MKNTLRRILLVVAISVLALSTHNPVSVHSQGTTITGGVIDHITGAPLRAEIGISFGANRVLSLSHAAASEQGEYVIEGLPAGKIHLVTKLDGYASEHQSVTLAAGETLRADFRLVKVKVVRGTVRDPTGLPLAGAAVRVIYSSETPARGAVATTYQWETGETQTDELGNYSVGIHPQKAFVVEASHPDFLGVVLPPRGIGNLDQEAIVNLSLAGGVAVSGRVTDANGNSVTGAQVRLVEIGARRQFPGFASFDLLRDQSRYTASDTNGSFRFLRVKATKKMLVVIHPGYRPSKQAVVLTPSQADTRATVVLGPRPGNQ